MGKLSLPLRFLLIFLGAFTGLMLLISAVSYWQFSGYAQDIARGRLQSDANSITDSTVLGIWPDDVALLMAEQEDPDNDIRADYIAYFDEIVTDYQDLDNLTVELQIRYIDTDQRELTRLVNVTPNEALPITTDPITDEEEWRDLVDSTQEPLAFEIFQDENGLWTTSSAPILTLDGEPTGGVLFTFIRADDQLAAVRAQVRNIILISAGVAYPVLIVIILMVGYSLVRPMHGFIMAAQALDKGLVYNPNWLAKLITRGDEIGQLARVFDHMAQEVQAREEKMKQEMVRLKIKIDYAKQREQVSEIVETDYFKDLKKRSQELRSGEATATTESKPTPITKLDYEGDRIADTDDYFASLKKRADTMKPDGTD